MRGGCNHAASRFPEGGRSQHNDGHHAAGFERSRCGGFAGRGRGHVCQRPGRRPVHGHSGVFACLFRSPRAQAGVFAGYAPRTVCRMAGRGSPQTPRVDVLSRCPPATRAGTGVVTTPGRVCARAVGGLPGTVQRGALLRADSRRGEPAVPRAGGNVFSGFDREQGNARGEPSAGRGGASRRLEMAG